MWSHLRHNSWSVTPTYIVHTKMLKLVLCHVPTVLNTLWKQHTTTWTFFFHLFFMCALTTSTLATSQMSKEAWKKKGGWPLSPSIRVIVFSVSLWLTQGRDAAMKDSDRVPWSFVHLRMPHVCLNVSVLLCCLTELKTSKWISQLSITFDNQKDRGLSSSAN